MLGDEFGQEPASSRRDMSCRAGIEQNARVSSMKPDSLENPAVSVTDRWKIRISLGLSRNHQGTPTNTLG